MKLREAVADDAAEISGFLKELTSLGKRTRPDNEDFVRTYYIGDKYKLSCTVAEDTDGSILGFQSLKLARPGNEWSVTPGWGIIGTHIRPDASRKGVGRALFRATLDAAMQAGLEAIDATIAAANAEALGYYEAIGFRTYRSNDASIRKRFDLRK